MKKESSCQADVPQGTRLLFLSTPPALFWMQGLCGNGQTYPLYRLATYLSVIQERTGLTGIQVQLKAIKGN